ncbi:MAG TPA: hypothetical protein VHY18_03350 [Solirubrobacteraceae bacterium]|nr:hypothetical protein [Solirubrobacteraceae bacterium]
MNFGTSDPISRLVAADPARGLPVEESARALVWQRVLEGDRRSQEPRRTQPAGPHVHDGQIPRAQFSTGASFGGRHLRHLRRRTLVLAVPVLLALAGCGALAAGVIRFGAPVKPSPYIFPGPRAGNGTPLASTERLLPVATPDPEGGPAWGMRLYQTTRGLGCVQVGRVLDGRFGALGQYGAFKDDGRFHEVPVNAPQFSNNDCSNLDAHGRTFMNLSVFDQAASGWFGCGSCAPASSNKMNIPPGSGICEQGHERDLYYGLLGPDAQSITYTSKGHSVTQATSGPEGAYLLVTHATYNRFYDFQDASTGGVVPVSSPITAVHYRDGHTCHITARRLDRRSGCVHAVAARARGLRIAGGRTTHTGAGRPADPPPPRPRTPWRLRNADQLQVARGDRQSSPPLSDRMARTGYATAGQRLRLDRRRPVRRANHRRAL